MKEYDKEQPSREERPRIEAVLMQWISSTALNLVRNRVRTEFRKARIEQRSTEIEQVPEQEAFPVAIGEERFVVKDYLAFIRPYFEAAIRELSDTQRTVLVMHLFEDKPFAEILEILKERKIADREVALRTVQKRYQDAFRGFQESLLRLLRRDLNVGRLPVYEAEGVQQMVTKLESSLQRGRQRALQVA